MRADKLAPLHYGPWYGTILFFDFRDHGIDEYLLYRINGHVVDRQDDLHRIRLTGGFVE